MKNAQIRKEETLRYVAEIEEHELTDEVVRNKIYGEKVDKEKTTKKI